MVKTILCHVSDEKYDILTPQPPENVIYFSENSFITYFGQYLYLFDLDTMIENFNIEKVTTTGLAHLLNLNSEYSDCEYLRYSSQSLGYEWRIYEPIDVDKYCIGIIEHWNHMKGVIGKSGVDDAMKEIAIDLMRYKGELRE